MATMKSARHRTKEAHAMEKIYTDPEGLHVASADINYTHGIKVGKMVFISGQADTKDGKAQHPGDIAEQSRAAMDWIKVTLEKLGATMDDIVMLNTFYAGELSVEEWARSAKVRYSYFKGRGPTGTAIRVGDELNFPGMRVEINAIAVVD
jgi:enamine deaminase RidA (YjgF/YER057c/UK114 family)